jgi:hypothetical protein
MKQIQQPTFSLPRFHWLSNATLLAITAVNTPLIAAPVDNGSGSKATIDATKLHYSTAPSGNVSGALLTTQPIVSAVDLSNNVDTDYSGTITLTESSSGALSGTKQQSALSGVVSFTDLMYTATADHEGFVLTASDGSLSDIESGSLDSDVVATQLVFMTQPSPSTLAINVNTAFTTVPVVEAQDASNLLDSDFTETITLRENGAGTGVLANNALTATSGSATFTGLSLTHDRVETLQLVANDVDATGTDLPTVNSVTLSVGKADQTITFSVLDEQTFASGATFSAPASSDSGLAVILTSTTTAICSISGNTVTILSAGECGLTASQAGNDQFTAAVDSSQNITINKANQTLTFAKPDNQTFANGATFSASASSDSGLTVTLTSTTTGVCSASGTTISVISAGECSLTASQAGNNNVNAAADISQSITIDKANQSITFERPDNQTFVSGATFTTSTDSDSGLAVTLTSSSTDICRVAGDTVMMVSAGNCELNASQGGDTNYNAAEDVIHTITLSSYTLSISATTDGAENNDGTPTDAVFTISVTPSNTSGAAITGDIRYTGSAVSGSDYTAGATTFSIANGESSTTLTLAVTEDTRLEGDENIIATLSSPSTGVIATPSATATLADDDVSGTEIDVLGGAPLTPIATGDTSPRRLDGTDFGTTSGEQTFTIKNLGTDDLILSGLETVALAGNSSNAFSLSQSALTPLASNASTTFTIAYSAQAGVISTATVLINSNDADESTYRFSIQGGEVSEAIAPRAERLHAFLSADTEQRALVTFQNTGGTIQLSVDIVDSDGGEYRYGWSSPKADLNTLLSKAGGTLTDGSVISNPLDISSLPAGHYPVSFSISDSTFTVDSTYLSVIDFVLNVTAETITLDANNTDSDNDGLSDAEDNEPNNANNIPARLSNDDNYITTVQ